MTLSAAEAHELYERAWDVAFPLKQITKAYWNPDASDPGNGLDGGWWTDCWPCGRVRIPTHIALSLCRTAAEDWLNTQCEEVVVGGGFNWCVSRKDDPAQGFVSVFCGGELPGRDDGDETSNVFIRPTIHHALVAAVEAVAAAKSTPAT